MISRWPISEQGRSLGGVDTNRAARRGGKLGGRLEWGVHNSPKAIRVASAGPSGERECHNLRR